MTNETIIPQEAIAHNSPTDAHAPQHNNRKRRRSVASDRRIARSDSDSSPRRTTEPEGILPVLSRIEALLRVLVRHEIQPVIEEELKDPTLKGIYEATGEKSVREMSQQVGVGVATVSRTWARWEALGLVAKDGTRYRRLF